MQCPAQNVGQGSLLRIQISMYGFWNYMQLCVHRHLFPGKSIFPSKFSGGSESRALMHMCRRLQVAQAQGPGGILRSGIK